MWDELYKHRLPTGIGRPLRVLYALGPGDAVDSYRHWKISADVLSETSHTYSGAFFEFCRRTGHYGYAISSFDKPQKLVDGSMIIENRPKRLCGNGILYHASQSLYGISIILTALKWRADAVIVDSGTTHWAILAPLKLGGIPVVGVLHNVPWPNGYKPTGAFRRMVLASDAWFWRYVANAVLSNSPEGLRQVRELSCKHTPFALEYRAQFNRGDFSSISPPMPADRTPFRVMYAGRIERDKGVFDIVEIAGLVEHSCPGRVQFHICGDGPALEELKDSIERKGLSSVVRTHGKLLRPALLDFYARCHAVIVPTRSDFCEGLPRVCAEAVLSCRPVITSRLSNTLDVLPGAVVIAEPDNPRSYANLIRQLLEDRAYYERLCIACLSVQDQFYDARNSLTAALEKLFMTDRVQAC